MVRMSTYGFGGVEGHNSACNTAQHTLSECIKSQTMVPVGSRNLNLSGRLVSASGFCSPLPVYF